MAWRPSVDGAYGTTRGNELYYAIEHVWDRAVPTAALPRHNPRFRLDYVASRRGDRPEKSKVLVSRLPVALRNVGLGETEADLIDFVLNYSQNRVLLLHGSKGVGKTSLLNFVEQTLTDALPERRMMFLTLNCLQIPDDASLDNYVELLDEELAAHENDQDSTYLIAFRAARQELTQSDGRLAARRACKKLASLIPSGDVKSVTLVIDNLDQASAAAIDAAMQLAREVHVGSGLGVIVALRPASMRRLQARGSAEAFFQMSIRVQPPTIGEYLSHLSSRIQHAAREIEKEGNSRPVINERALSPEAIGRAIARFAELLKDRIPTDDPAGLLNAVSANDTRHLILLLRDILAHRHLPVRYLLGLEPSAGGDFHPITAMMEGPQTLYVRRRFLPNLLHMELPDGNSDFVVQHRLLQLLDRERLRDVGDLISWLEPYGYHGSATIAALKVLQEASLISYNDTERPRQGIGRPDSCLLTEAGEYYRNHILRLGDYLLAAVTDVPLAHEAILRAGPGYIVHDSGFADRLKSLGEYLEEVWRVEARQVNTLRTSPPSPAARKAADALRHGGLLTNYLAAGFDDLLERSRKSRSDQVRAGIPDIERQVALYRSRLQSVGQRLEEAVNRGRKFQPSAVTTLAKYADEAGTLEITGTRTGDDLEVYAEMDLQGTQEAAVVACTAGPNPRCRFGLAVTEPGETENRLGVALSTVPDGGDESPVTRMTAQVLRLPEQHKTAFLLANEEAGCLRVDAVFPSSSSGSEIVPVGTGVKLTELRPLVKELVTTIGHAVVRGMSPRRLHSELRVVGTQLCDLLMHKEGQRMLASHLRSVDTLVIQTTELSVPWEWLCLAGSQPGQQGAMIGGAWRTIRWPVDKYRAVMLRLNSQSPPAGVLKTVGDVEIASQATCFEDLVHWGSQADSFHLIGHYGGRDSQSGLHLGEDLVLSRAAVRAYTVSTSAVVLSTCGAGGMQLESSLPVAISEAWRCVAWAPIVEITDELAMALDKEMREFLRSTPAASLDDYFGTSHESDPFKRLYCRYGLS